MKHNDLPEPIQIHMGLAVRELEACNPVTARYGLQLSDAQIVRLVEQRFAALRETGRIEFGSGILPKLVLHFCDSPYVNQDQFEEILSELQDSFYYFKNESQNRLDDDQLLEFMKYHFDHVCHGSLEYLSGTSLEDLCRSARMGEDGWEPESLL